MKLLILASHPVQYHAPVFRAISERLTARGDECTVVYLSDFSIQGYRDIEFGTSFAWDEPLLAGYTSRIVNEKQTQQPAGFKDLDAPGFGQILIDEKPDRMLVHSLNYRGAVWATILARLRGVPCTLRVETNDEAVARSPLKAKIRSLAYRLLYTLFDSAIAISTLNKNHVTQHGIKPNRVGLAYYCVPDRFIDIPAAEKQRLRETVRQDLLLGDRTTILFSGKLIPKKNPGLILDGIAQLTPDQQQRLAVVYLGSGQLEKELRIKATQLPNVKIHFAGFKNQKELPPYYLAADVATLPSQQAGETWGLVMNEAMQAGLPCIATNAVGSSVDFAGVPNFQVIPIGDATAMARAIAQLINLNRDFERYGEVMKNFSTDAAASNIVEWLRRF
ncbi:MAG: glycosyltransferase family 4 protein [Cyanobacteria bacterium P01_H01_bin.130]